MKMIKRYPVFTAVTQPRPMAFGEKKEKKSRKYDRKVPGPAFALGDANFTF